MTPPDAQAESVPIARDGEPVVAVVGAGFSGTLLALHLLRQVKTPIRVLLIERNAQFGRGPAYAAGNSSHLLNVPTAKMSAFHADPLHFLAWLRQEGLRPDSMRPEDGTGTIDGGTFVPRHMFGRYVRHLLNAEIKGDTLDRLTLVRGDVVDIAHDADGLCLSLDRGRVLRADRAVLAVGNFPPAPPPVADRSFYDTGFYRPDPWAPDTLADLAPEHPVLLIGTGLTMVDTVISLLDQGHTGPVIALSRRGLLPNRHAAPGLSATLPEAPAFPTSVTALARFLRDRSARSLDGGGSWQAAIDELRPVTTEVWQAMSVEDRRRFLRHIRPWWDIHRHRIAGPVADRLDDARRRRQLGVLAGHITGYEIAGDHVTVAYRPRGGDGTERVVTTRVINCSGPDADYARIRDRLVRSLLDKGLVRPDPLSFGLDVTGTCALLGRDGTISRRLFAVGPVTKGAFWEMTAVPDIRQQAEFVAERLAAICKPVPVRHRDGASQKIA